MLKVLITHQSLSVLQNKMRILTNYNAYFNTIFYLFIFLGFGKSIPDLKWDVKDIIISAKGDKVFVQSVASGTPSSLMGINLNSIIIITVGLKCLNVI